MHKEYITCDGPGCQASQQIQPPTYGIISIPWIKVARTTSRSGENLPAGETHFCSESCLTNLLSLPKHHAS